MTLSKGHIVAEATVVWACHHVVAVKFQWPYCACRVHSSVVGLYAVAKDVQGCLIRDISVCRQGFIRESWARICS